MCRTDPTVLLSQSEEESKSWLKYKDTLANLSHSSNLKKELNFLFTQQRTKTPYKRNVLFSKLNLVALQLKDTISSKEIFKQSTKLRPWCNIGFMNLDCEIISITVLFS